MKKMPDQFFREHPQLEPLRNNTEQAVAAIIKCYTEEGKILLCGNGGSSSQADHIAAELMKSFEVKRPLDPSLKKRLISLSAARGKFLAGNLEHALPAISLSGNPALITAISNDKSADLVFAQQIMGYGQEKDILLAISTSGNSRNIIDACITARALNLKVIGLTGKTGGEMKDLCDILLNVPETRTAFIQELQLPLIHAICMAVEDHFYGN